MCDNSKITNAEKNEKKCDWIAIKLCSSHSECDNNWQKTGREYNKG